MKRQKIIHANKFSRWLIPGLLMFGLAGCSWPASPLSFMPSIPAIPSLPSFSEAFGDLGGGECASVSPKALKRVNWTRVPQINMRIRNNEYEPMIVQMTQGWPYVFRIRNRDKKSHSFNASRFLRSMAVIRVSINGQRQDETCLSSLTIPPNSTAEIYLVAAHDGHYEFEDNWLSAMSLISGGADGVIIVEERHKTRLD